jgi:hypothetical protein
MQTISRMSFFRPAGLSGFFMFTVGVSGVHTGVSRVPEGTVSGVPGCDVSYVAAGVPDVAAPDFTGVPQPGQNRLPSFNSFPQFTQYMAVPSPFSAWS